MGGTKPAKPPIWYTVSSVVFLVWNLFGFLVFVLTMTVFSSREALEGAELTEEQIELTLSIPIWVNIVFGIAVISGVAGCIGLLFRMRFAVMVLGISLMAVLLQNVYMYLLSDAVKIMGVGASPFVIMGSIALVPFAWYGVQKQWLS